MTVPTFPTNLRGRKYPTVRHILSKTLQEEAYSGDTTAFPAWSYPRYQYEVSFSVLRSTTVTSDWQTLEGFIKLVKFSAGCLFQFYFPDDSAVTDQAFGIGDGTTLAFQLCRTLGGFTEPVYAVSAITNIKVAGSTVSSSFYSVDARGVLTFSAGHAPTTGAAITWTGTYNWYCRFDEDDESLSRFAYTFWELGKITFTTVKSP